MNDFNFSPNFEEALKLATLMGDEQLIQAIEEKDDDKVQILIDSYEMRDTVTITDDGKIHINIL